MTTAMSDILPAWMYALPRTKGVCEIHNENLREIKNLCDVCLSCHEQKTIEHAKLSKASIHIVKAIDHTDDGQAF